MRRSKTVSALALLTGAALVLGACGGGGGEGGDTGTSQGGSRTGAKGDNGDGTYNAPEVPAGGEVVVGHDAPYTAYNNQAADANNFNNTLVTNMVLTEPFVVDDKLQVLLNKDVMEEVTLTSEDPQVVTYKIKPGVKWSDGEAWDCDDFYLSWLAQSGKAVKKDASGNPITDENGNPSRYFAPASTTGYELVTAECKDDLTFVNTYSEKFADYQSLYIQGAILPAHILEKETGVADITKVTPDSPAEELQKVADFWNTAWNGFKPELMPASGPYKIESWQQGQSVTLVRNPNWIGKPGGPERIVMRSIADPTAQKQSLENQELHVIAPQADPSVADQLRALSAQGVKYEAGGGLTFEHLDLNFKNPLFQDPAVRKAFAQCIDRNEIVEKLVRGVDPEAKPLGSIMFLPQEEGYQDNYSSLMVANPDEAKKTLEAAGWTLGSDGIFVKDGKRLSFRISHTDIPRRQQTVALIMSSCRKAGIDIQDDTDPNFLDTRVSQGDYDVALFAWVGTPFKSSKKSIYITGGGQNWQGVSNATVDAELPKVDSEFDEAKRIELLQTVDKALAEEIATLPLFQLPNMWAYSDKVDKVTYQGSNGVTWNAWEWQVS